MIPDDGICRFIGALTRGGPGGMPRPIEMHAHDPRRFVSDMLAWVHQARTQHWLCLLLAVRTCLHGHKTLPPHATCSDTHLHGHENTLVRAQDLAFACCLQ